MRLTRRGRRKKLKFVEGGLNPLLQEELRLKEFLHDASINGDATMEDLVHLYQRTFETPRPTL